MKKIYLLFFLLIFYSSSIHSQTYQPLIINGFNEDVIANGIGTALSSTTNDIDGGGYCLKSIDWKQTVASTAQTTGLPLNGIVASNVSLTPGLTYQLQNYSNNNSIRIAYGGASITSLVTGNVKAKKLFVLATTGAYYSNMQCTITFADNTTQEFLTNNVPDWFNGATPPPAFIGFGRLLRNSSTVEDPYNNPRLYQIELNIATANQNKEIQSITFGRTGSTPGVLNIFAVSAELALCNAPGLISATPGSICGYGTAELTANYNTGTVRWFANATGGTALHTGATFTTPIINTTTSYWVSSTGATQTTGTVGPTSPTTQGGTVGTQSTAWDVEFSVLNETVLNSIDIFPMASGENGNIQVRTISGTLIQTYPFTTNVSGGTVAQTILLNHAFIPGQYELYVSLPTNGIRRNVSGAIYPYTSPSINILRNGYDQTFFMGFYNWKYTTVCNSPRTEVIATVTPAPVLTLSETNVVLCAGQSQTVTIASGITNYDSYTITPTAGVTGNATTGWVFSPSVSTVYTLSAKQTTGALCAKDILINVKVNPVPVINTNVNTVNTCVNEITSITSTISGLNKNVTFGEGTSVTAIRELPNPLTTWYGGNKTQMLYLATELTAKGFFAGSRIQSLAFDVVTFDVNGICNDFRIKIGNTNLSALTNSLQNSANLQTVYNQTFAPTQTGWVTFNFATPFIWDGVSNIIIETAHNSGNWGNGAGTTIRYSETPFASCSYGLSDSVTPAGVSSFDAVTTFGSNNSSSNRPNVILGTNEIPTSVWSPVDHLYTDALATVPYVAGTSAANVYLKANTPVNVQDYTLTVTTQSNCSATKIINVTVHETPAPIITETNYCITNTLADVEATFTPVGVVKWYDAPTAGTELPLTTPLANGTTYYAEQIANGCTSLTRASVTVVVHETLVPTVVNPVQSFCIQNNATLADVIVDGTDVKWYDAASAGNELPISTLVVDGTTYYASQTLNGCESVLRTAVQVSIHNISATTTKIDVACNGGNSGSATVTATGGTGIYSYLWNDVNAQTTATANGLTAGTYTVTITDANGCSKTETVTISEPTAISATTTKTDVACNGGNSGSATVTATGGTGIYSYLWNDANAQTTATANGLTAGTYTVTITDANACTITRTVTITEPALVTAPNMISPQNFCNFARINNLEIPLGSSIIWYDTATVGKPLLEHTALVTATYYAAQVVNGCESPVRTPVDVIVDKLQAPYINGNGTVYEVGNFTGYNQDVVFDGTDNTSISVSFDGGSGYLVAETTKLNNVSPIRYMPKNRLIASETTPGLMFKLQPYNQNNSLHISYGTTSSLTPVSGISNVHSLYVLGASGDGVTNLDITVNFTDGTSQLFSNNILNDWFYQQNYEINGLGRIWGNAIENFTDNPRLYKLTLPLDPTYYSKTISTINFTHTSGAVPNVMGVSYKKVEEATVCDGALLSDLTVSGSNIKWYADENIQTTLPTNTLLTNKTTYFASQTIGTCESIRTPFYINVTPLPSPPLANNQGFCLADQKTVADLVVTGNDVKWYADATSTAALAPSTVLTSGTYYATQTLNGCESVSRTPVVVTIYDTAAPTAPDQAYCIAEAKTVADLVVTGTAVKWFANATSTTALVSSTVLTSGTYYASQTLNGCESVNRIPVVVTIYDTAVPTATDQAYCIAEAKTLADLVVTGTDVKWYADATSTTALAPATVLTSGTYYATQTLNGCESVSRTPVAVTIYNTAVPTATDQAYCIAEAKTVADLVVTGTDVKWYADATSTTALAPVTVLTSGTYYATQTLNGCESVNRTSVVVTIYDTVAPTATDQAYCIAEAKTVADLVVTGTDVKWYDAASAGNELPISTLLVDGTSYYASQTLNGCESVNRTPVVVTIYDTPATTATDQAYCIAEAKTIGDLVVTGTAVKWYADATSTTALAPVTVLTSGTYYATQTLNGCESVNRTPVVVIIYDTPAPTAPDQAYCIAEAKTVADLVVTGTDVKWYANATSTVVLAPSTVLTNGMYYATQTLNGCESVSRKAVQVTIHDTPAPIAQDQAYCIAEAKTVADLVVTGTALKWYADATSTTVLAPSTVLTNGIYYATQTLNGCESVSRKAVQVTIHDTAAPIAQDQAYCIAEAKTIGDLVVTGTAVKWYADATSTAVLAPATVLTSGTYYATQTLNGCESVSRKAVQVTIYDTAAPTAIGSQYFCSNENATIQDILILGTNVKWYASSSSVSALNNTMLLTNNTTYYATQTLNGCESVNRVAVTINLHPVLPITSTNLTVCYNTLISQVAIDGFGSNELIWFDNNNDTVPMTKSTPLSTRTYYVSTYTNGRCVSVKKPIAITVLSQIPLPIANSQVFCGSATVNNLIANTTPGGVAKWYTSMQSTQALPTNTSLLSGVYYVEQVIGACNSARVAVSVKIVSLQAPKVTNVALCAGATVNDIPKSTIPNIQYVWFDSVNATTPLLNSHVLTSGNYYVAQIQDGCLSNKSKIYITVNAKPNKPTGQLVQTFKDAATVRDIKMNEFSVYYFNTMNDALNGTNALPFTRALVDGETLYAVHVGANGCMSDPETVQVFIVLSNESREIEGLKYYPNPVNDILNIECIEDIESLEMYDLTGKLIWKVKTNTNFENIDMKSFTSGTYLIKIKTNSSTQFVKIIKK